MSTLDKQLILMDAQAITTSAASANILDFGTVQKNIGVGEPLSIWVTVGVAPVATGTYSLALRSSATQSGAALSGTILTHLTRTISPTALAGSQLEIPIPRDLYNALNKEGLLEYVDLNLTTGGSNPAITLSADLRPSSMGENYSGGNIASGFTVK